MILRSLCALALAWSALGAPVLADEPAPERSWQWLPESGIYRLPIADTRSPLTAVLMRSHAEGVAIDANLAAEIRIGQLDRDDLQLQVGIAGAGFMGFIAGGALTFDFQTFDGYFGFPVDLTWDRWGVRLQWAHISAHTADGVEKHPIDPPAVEGSVSFEYLQLLGGPRFEWGRVYGGPRLTTHSIHESEPWMLQVGGEFTPPWRRAPFAAVDLKVDQVWGWSPSVSGQIGGLFHRGDQRFRIAVAGYAGMEDTGKLWGRPERYLGAVMGFGGAGSLL